MNSKRKFHSEVELHMASKYLLYHIKMYVNTLLWLRENRYSTEWNTVRNAVLEDHLIHARILITFLSQLTGHERLDDVLAVDFFHDLIDVYEPLKNEFLREQASHIGGHMLHITTKPMPKNKSQQEWHIEKMANELVPALKKFYIVVPETRLMQGARSECLEQLAKLSPPMSSVPYMAST